MWSKDLLAASQGQLAEKPTDGDQQTRWRRFAIGNELHQVRYDGHHALFQTDLRRFV